MVKLVRVFAVVLCLIPLAAAAAPVPEAPASGKALYVVQLEGAPLARSRSLAIGGPRKPDFTSVASLRSLEALQARQDAALAAVSAAVGRDVEAVHRYSIAFNGVALELTETEAAALARVPGVLRVEPDHRYRLSSDVSPALTGAPGIWNGTTTGGLPGTKGEGIVIGVIDTGIAFGHPSFADIGGDGYNHTNPRGSGNYLGWCNPSHPKYDPTLACNDKLIGAWSFTQAGNDPRDDNGHGTQTASIAAGNHVTATLPGTSLTRQISGVAPHANLVAYDACTADDGCWGSDVLAAIDQAVLDGVDVLNLSIAYYGTMPWNDLLTRGLLDARDAGVFVTAALYDYDEIGSPGEAPWLLAVGASSHSRQFQSSLVGVSGGTTPPPTLPGLSLTNAYGPVSIVNAWSYGDSYCEDPFPPGTFSGQIVVCEHAYYHQELAKGQNVLAGGGGGIILAEYSSNFEVEPIANALPSVRLPSNVSPKLWTWLGSGSNHVARITATVADLDSSRADRLWPGSPYGLDYYWSYDRAYILKPDVVAPGQEILAAHLSSSYKVASGTSMAAAHAAGAAALLIDLHPGWTPAEVQSALQTTGAPITRPDGSAANPFDMGGGRLSLGAAARAGLVLDVTTAAFQAANPEIGGNPRTLNLAGLVHDRCIGSCGWTRVVRSTLSTTSTWNVSVEAPAGITLNVTPASFTLGPGATQSLQITASGPNNLGQWRFGRIVLTETGAQAPQARLPLATFWVDHELVTVQKGGTGAGRVTSNPAGIDCGSDCSELYPNDIQVTLTAAASPGSIFVGWDGACSGLSPSCTVSTYYAPAVTAYFNPPYPDKSLTNQVPVKDSINGPVSGGTWKYYSVDLGSGNDELVVDLLDLTGEVGLYVRSGAKPTGWDDADCVDDYSSYGTYNRRCVILDPEPGRWWIGVNNEDENVTIRYTVRASWGNSNDRELANRSPLSDYLNSFPSGAGWKYYFVDLPAGSSNLSVELSKLSADADLYVRFGAKPDRTNHDCESSEGSTLPDACQIPSPAAGRWWIGINNFSTGTINYSLRASWWTVDTPTDFYSVSPCRVLDTRTGSPQPLLSGVPRPVQVTGLCGIPSTAKAVAANVTVTGGTGAGYLVLYPGDEGIPSTGTINFAAGQTRANNVLLKLGGNGTGNLGALSNLTGLGQVHLIVDVNGYFE